MANQRGHLIMSWNGRDFVLNEAGIQLLGRQDYRDIHFKVRTAERIGAGIIEFSCTKLDTGAIVRLYLKESDVIWLTKATKRSTHG